MSWGKLQMPTEGWLVQSLSLKEWHQARARAPVVRLRRKRGERYYQYHKLSQSHHESPDGESWHNRAVHSQRVSSKACKARYQHVRMGIPAGDSLDFIDSRKHVPFFMHFWELKFYLFIFTASFTPTQLSGSWATSNASNTVGIKEDTK